MLKVRQPVRNSVSVYYSYSDSNWVLLRLDCRIDGSFDVAVDLPCVNFYECIGPDLDSMIYLHVLGLKSGISDTAQSISIRLMPKPFPLSFDSCPTPCRTRTFTWDIAKLGFPCDTVSVSISFDCGNTFGNIARIPVSDEKFIWNVPLEPKRLHVCTFLL